MRLVLSCSLFVLALAGCDTNPTTDTVPSLAGAWRWISSTDVESGEVHLPTTEGYDARLTFAPDGDRAGTYRYARVGGEAALVVDGRYTVSYEDAPGNDFIGIDSPIDFLDEAAWIGLGSDTLRLGGVFESGYTTLYARER